MKNNSTAGFTLGDALIVLLVLGVAGAAVLTIGLLVWNPQRLAGDAAQNYIERLDGDYRLIGCNARDNDGDGKVSCTIEDTENRVLTTIDCETGLVLPGRQRFCSQKTLAIN